MFPSLRRIIVLGVTTTAGALFFLGAAVPAAAQEEFPVVPEGEQGTQELPEETESQQATEVEGSQGLLGPILGQSGLVTVFIGNYQINH